MLRPRRIEKARSRVLKALNKDEKLNDHELMLLWGLVGYDMGRSFHGKEETLQELERLYKESPSVEIAFMLQTVMVQNWVYDEEKRQDGSKRDSEPDSEAP